MVLQSCTNCGVSKVSFAVQLLFVGAAFLVIKVNALTLDPFKFIVLCAEGVYISHNAGIPQMIECIVHYEVTGAAGVKDGMVGVFDTRAIEIGGGECLRMEGGPKDCFILAIHALVD